MTNTLRSTVASRRGKYLIGVSALARARAGVATGDDVALAVELDDRRLSVVREMRKR